MGRRFDPDRAHNQNFAGQEGKLLQVNPEDNLDFLVAERLYCGISGHLYQRIHPQLERRVWPNATSNSSVFKILEIGAGSGEHFKFVKRYFSHYCMLDISDFGYKKIEKIISNDGRCKFVLASAEHLPFSSESFEHVVATCVFAHLENPEIGLQELRRVLKNSGTASILLSSDPSLLLRVTRNLFVSRKMSDLPIDYDLYIKKAHRNSIKSLLKAIDLVFRKEELKIIYYPFRFPFWNLSTHVIVHVRKLTKSYAQD